MAETAVAGMRLMMAAAAIRLGEFVRLLDRQVQPWLINSLNRLSAPNTWVGQRRAKTLRRRGVAVVHDPLRTGPMRWGYSKNRPVRFIVQ